MAEEGSKPKTLQEILIGGFRDLLKRDFILLGLLIGVIAIALLMGKSALAQQVDAGMTGVKEEQVRQAAEIERLKSAQNEIQTDIRALYKAVMTGQKQERLEKPAVQDGGQ